MQLFEALARGLQEGGVHRVLQQRGHDRRVPTPRGPVRQVKTRARDEPSRFSLKFYNPGEDCTTSNFAKALETFIGVKVKSI